MIKDEEPPKPSTRLSSSGEALVSISAQRKTEPAKLSKLMRGELDWIVMKCLEKDRNRRYETANAFAADVQRYLNDETVQACPPSTLYRFLKFARRNKAALATSSVVALAVLVAVGVLATSTVLIARSLRAETEAKGKLAIALESEEQDAYFHRIALADRELSVDNLRRARELLDACPERLRGWEWHYLTRLCRFEPLVIWDATAVNSIAFSPNGEWIASAGNDGAIKIWNSKTGKPARKPFQAHEGFVSCVTFHPHGNHLASVGADRLVKVWDLTTDPPVQVSPPRPCDSVHVMGTAYAVAFRPPDGQQLAVGNDGAVNLWDWQNNRFQRIYGGHGNVPISVSFSRDGRWLASGDWLGGLKLWDMDASGEPRHFPEITGTHSPISALAFRPDSSKLAVASYGRRVDVWDMSSFGHKRMLPHGGVVVLGAAYSVNGVLASAGEDKTVHIWDPATEREVLSLRGHTGLCGCVVFSPDGLRLASAGKDRSIRIWDATPLQGDEGQEARTYRHHHNEIWSLAVSPPDGRMVVSGGLGSPPTVWDPQTGDVIATIPGQKDIVFCVAWEPGGQRIASAGADGGRFTVKVWNLQSRTEDLELSGRVEYVAVAFSPDRRYLVTGQVNGAVQVWDAATGKEVRPLGTHKQPTRGLVFSNDGRWLASASSDGTVHLWDATKLDKEQVPRVLRARVHGQCLNVAFSPDSRYLATGGEDYTVKDYTVKIWDAETNAEVKTLRGHAGDVYTVAFSADGRWFVSAGEDSTVKVWDRQNGYQLVRTLRGHIGLINSLAFSPDGKQLFSGSRDHTVKVWDVTRWGEELER